MGAMAQAGIMANGDGQHPPHTATTLRVRNGKRGVQDAPYADVKEQLGGYVVIEVAGLDAAKSPSAEYGSGSAPRAATAGALNEQARRPHCPKPLCAAATGVSCLSSCGRRATLPCRGMIPWPASRLANR